MKLIACAVGLAVLAQQQPATPGMHYNPAAGFSINLPPKNDEWAFREKQKGGDPPVGAMFKDSKLVVAHKVDELAIEILSFDQTSDLKKQVEADWNNISGSPNFKDAKRIEMKAGKLPGTSVNCQYLEVEFLRSDKKTEYREWVVVGKENQCTYIIMMHGDEGMYKKRQKEADLILSTFKTWKKPK